MNDKNISAPLEEEVEDVTVSGSRAASVFLKGWLKDLVTNQKLTFRLYGDRGILLEAYDWDPSDLSETIENLVAMIMEDAEEDALQHRGSARHFHVETMVGHTQKKKCAFVLRAFEEAEEKEFEKVETDNEQALRGAQMVARALRVIEVALVLGFLSFLTLAGLLAWVLHHGS